MCSDDMKELMRGLIKKSKSDIKRREKYWTTPQQAKPNTSISINAWPHLLPVEDDSDEDEDVNIKTTD